MTKAGATARRRCTGNEKLTPKVYVQESKIQFVFDAVYAFAHALDRMTSELCGRVRGRRARRRCLRGLDGQHLYTNYLLNVSVDGTPQQGSVTVAGPEVDGRGLRRLSGVLASWRRASRLSLTPSDGRLTFN